MKNKIYTKKGDGGLTSLLSGDRILKTSPIITAVGTVDELNSFIGLLTSTNGNDNKLSGVYISGYKLEDSKIIKDSSSSLNIASFLGVVQWDLFLAGSMLINDNGTELESVTDDSIKQIESLIDILSEKLPPIKHFIIPNGGVGRSEQATAHICRTVCRRAETEVLRIMQSDSGIIPITNIEMVFKYLNRLSDLFFVLARWIGYCEGFSEKPFGRGFTNNI